MSRKLRRALAAIDGVEEFDSAFQDDVGYWVNGEEIAHFKRRPSSSSWSRRQRRPIGRFPAPSRLRRRRRFH
jgi:hypothetical protein